MIDDRLEIVDKPLEQWIAKEEYKECFPSFGTTDYSKCYELMAEYMNKHVHPEVTLGAVVQQVKRTPKLSYNELLYLNDHGEDHVKMVIQKASELLIESKAPITPYEGYIFLVAAHFHDVGTWLGRDGHEKKINEVMRRKGIKKHLPDDELVLKVIKKIAQAHGGNVAGDKDTINYVKRETKLNERGIRKQFLAALLRFADELADNRTRASRFVVSNNGGETKVPKISLIFHEYSNSLHTVEVNKNEINLEYYIPQSKVAMQYPKKTKIGERERQVRVFLCDEIYNRTIKMHKEKMYCMRFLMSGGIFIEKIKVIIEIVDDGYNKTLDEIPYELKESGYPGDSRDIFQLCPQIKGKDGRWLMRKFGRKGKN